MEHVSLWIRHYGYLGVFSSLMLGMFGLPVPDESILTFTGFLVSKHYLRLIPAILAAFLGSIAGISLNYTVGRVFGQPFLKKYGPRILITEEKLNKVHDWFDRYGKWSLFAGYFFPGVRHLTPFIAGTARLRVVVFALFAYSGALLWATSFTLVGYYLGKEWFRIIPVVHRYLVTVGGAVMAVAAAYVLVKVLRDRKAG
jgi:membrane protein DedA with SNARE-associated domain